MKQNPQSSQFPTGRSAETQKQSVADKSVEGKSSDTQMNIKHTNEHQTYYLSIYGIYIAHTQYFH